MSTGACETSVRVIKLGGSLLDWPEFPGQLRSWLARQSPAYNLLLVGGGELVEAIRKLDSIHCIGEKGAHWNCIRSLRITAAILGDLFPEFKPAPRELAGDGTGTYLLDAEWLMEEDRRRSVRPLPESWDVTTDSIAARAAVLYSAAELVLLKSKLPDRAGNLRTLADAGYVDAHFPVCAKSLSRIRFVNLRDPDLREAEISGAGR